MLWKLDVFSNEIIIHVILKGNRGVRKDTLYIEKNSCLYSMYTYSYICKHNLPMHNLCIDDFSGKWFFCSSFMKICRFHPEIALRDI